LQLKAMGIMGYDAMNMGVPELLLADMLSGKESTGGARSNEAFPYIASNLLFDCCRPPGVREYLIKEVGGLRVAILGIIDPDQLKNRDDLKEFKVIEPKAALSKLIPEIRAKADVVVLMCQMGEMPAMALVEAVPGIDVAVFAERNYLMKPPEKHAILLDTGEKGAALGLLTVTLDDKRRVGVSERRTIVLDESVPDNKAMLGLVETHKREQWLKENKEKLEVLQLTPEQFMQQYKPQETKN
jgi:5'-nucleotidase/UDP-sugar diphosphatase